MGKGPRGGVGEKGRGIKRIKMCYMHASTHHDEYDHYVPHTCINKNFKNYLEKKRLNLAFKEKWK